MLTAIVLVTGDRPFWAGVTKRGDAKAFHLTMRVGMQIVTYFYVPCV